MVGIVDLTEAKFWLLLDVLFSISVGYYLILQSHYMPLNVLSGLRIPSCNLVAVDSLSFRALVLLHTFSRRGSTADLRITVLSMTRCVLVIERYLLISVSVVGAEEA